MLEFARDLGYSGEGPYYSLLLGANAAGAMIAGIVLEAGSMLSGKDADVFILGVIPGAYDFRLWQFRITSTRVRFVVCWISQISRSTR